MNEIYKWLIAVLIYGLAALGAYAFIVFLVNWILGTGVTEHISLK
jgi:hypothetical protein